MYKVILIEDEAIIRKGLHYGFDYSKYDCVVIAEASDGQQAVTKIRELMPDIVLMDINLPIKSGLKVLEETNDLKYSAIILSGYSDFEFAQKAVSLQVVDYLLKPLDYEKLGQALIKAKHKRDQAVLIEQFQHQNESVQNINLLSSIRKTTNLLAQQMIEYIHRNYQEKFTFSDVVNHFGYSETHLTNKFKKHTELTFNDYLNRYRITMAIEKMKNGLLDLNVLADECGFNNVQYFDKVFTKYVLISVKQFQSLL